ncbi:WAT1-related protein At3g30340-like isoform X1 [Musa acuminata AAA Group]|uniref:WAT1-related protein At3g30340-like isoform X1 n=1 Tax=Musa acuminata AAA Group TaxID=214697 RepID=UPI0031E22299
MACNWSEWRSVFAMLAVDVMLAVMNTMVKKVMEEGMNKLILITLRQLIATLFMAPIAYFHERKTRPKLTVEIFVYIFFSALIGVSLMQFLFFLGLHYTSATFAYAFLNVSPVFTFLISLALRMESLNPKTKAGIAKAIGATVCFTGVIVLMFYKGVALNQAPHRSTASAQPQSPLPPAMSYTSSTWLMASLALLAGCFCLSSWFPLQSKLGEKYPALYSCTALMFFLSFLQTAAMSLATVRGHSVWLLRKKLEIATVIFSGIAGSGLGFLAMSWCVEQRGPVFTAAFMPFVQIFGAGIDFTILHEQVYLGSVLGSLLVIAGLYSLLWGKNKEARSCAAKAAEGNGENQVQVQLQSV